MRMKQKQETIMALILFLIGFSQYLEFMKISDEHIICLKIRYNYYLVYQNILSLLELVVPVSNHTSYLMTKVVGNFSHLRCNQSNCKIWFHFCRLRTKIDKQLHLKYLSHFPTALLQKCSILL